MNLSGKRALIIGGSSGIGLAIADTFCAEGAHVTIAARTQPRLEDAVRTLGGRAEAAQLDTADEFAVRDLIRSIGSLDVLVVSAASRGAGGLAELTSETLLAAFRVKFLGVFYAAKYGSEVMGAGSTLITFSGVWGHRPPPGFLPGAAVNGAVEALTRALAIELAPRGIRVNCIAPGITKTNPYIDECSDQMRSHLAAVPLRRFAHAPEVAQAALYLATNSYVTGTVLFVDGGSMAAW